MTPFVYPRITTESDKHEICDVTQGSAIRVEPHRVDNAIRVREDSIVSGREALVEEFEQMLKGIGDILTPTGVRVLPGAFRRFLAANERALKRSGHGFSASEADTYNRDNTPLLDPALTQNLESFLNDNDDCYDAGYRSEVQQRITAFLSHYAGDGKIVASSKRALARRFERFIEETPDDKDRRKGLIQRLKASENPLERDLAAIMHLVMWDEIERLERLSA